MIMNVHFTIRSPQAAPSLYRLAQNTVGQWGLKLCLCTVLIFSPLSAYVAKINDHVIPLSELQQYINVQKFLVKEPELEKFLELKKTTRSRLLSDYIELKLLYLAADSKSYTIAKKHKTLTALYKETLEQQLSTLYVNSQIDLPQTTLNEAELKKEFANLKGASPKSFAELSSKEKKELYQLSILRKLQNQKEAYRFQLEKKYKVKRSPKNKTIAASVNNVKLTRKAADELLSKEVAKLGLSLTVLKKRDPSKLQEIRKDAINELIFQEMVKLEIKAINFAQKPVVQHALKFYRYQLAIEEYAQTELTQNIKISSSELDAAFVEISRTRPNIQQLLPTQQEKFLRSVIIRNKLPELMQDLVNEKKEEAIIKRDKTELAKLR